MPKRAWRSALRAQVSRGTRLVVTGTNATGLPGSEALAWFSECPGGAYLAAPEKSFQQTNPSAATDLIKALAADPPRSNAGDTIAGISRTVGFNELTTLWHMDHYFIHDITAIENLLLTLALAFVSTCLFYERNLKPQARRHLGRLALAARMGDELSRLAGANTWPSG